MLCLLLRKCVCEENSSSDHDGRYLCGAQIPCEEEKATSSSAANVKYLDIEQIWIGSQVSVIMVVKM